MKPVRTAYQQFSNDMTAAIDTGNRDEAELTLIHAQAALEDGRLSIVQMGELQADFNAAF